MYAIQNGMQVDGRQSRAAQRFPSESVRSELMGCFLDDRALLAAGAIDDAKRERHERRQPKLDAPWCRAWDL